MDGHERPFLVSLDPASCATLLGVALSLASMAFAAAGRIEPMAICAIWAGICDFLDGPLARRFPPRSPAAPRTGAHLDSVADMASFGIAPVAVAWLLGNRSPLDAVLCVAYVACVAQRLSFFGADEEDRAGRKRVAYAGLPVTFASLFLSLAYPVLPLFGAAALSWTLRGLLAALAFLYVANFPVPKPRGAAYPAFIAVALALSGFWIWRLGS
jgi:phosphatidylserine synthase